MKKVFLRGTSDDYKNYRDALTACGVQPVVSMELSEADSCDALLIPGGADIDPARYGQENTASVGIDESRDNDEIELVHRFMEQNKPIFGICRGHQIINVALGGTMIQHISCADRHVMLGEGIDNVHEVRALHPFMKRMYGDRFSVNSSHHQAVDKLGDGLIATCISDEGIIEGFIHENGRVLGVQFHPERISFAHLRPDAVDGEKLFRAFLSLI